MIWICAFLFYCLNSRLKSLLLSVPMDPSKNQLSSSASSSCERSQKASMSLNVLIHHRKMTSSTVFRHTGPIGSTHLSIIRDTNIIRFSHIITVLGTNIDASSSTKLSCYISYFFIGIIDYRCCAYLITA